MLKLPTNAGEWGFVIVLTVLFGGLAFATIFSQVHLHNMRRDQAWRDTESNLAVLAEAVRKYHRDHGRLESKLTAMGVPEESLRTRHATIADDVSSANGQVSITATLLKYDKHSCTLTLKPDGDGERVHWSD